MSEFSNFNFPTSPPSDENISEPGRTPLGSATDDCATEGDTSVTRSLKVPDTRTFLITISPPGDISDEMIEWFLKTYRDNNKYVVCERGKSGQRHLHALLQFDEHKEARNLRTTMWRVLKRIHTDSVTKALDIHCAYGLGFRV